MLFIFVLPISGQTPSLLKRLPNGSSTNPFKAFHSCTASTLFHTVSFCKYSTSPLLNTLSSSKQVPHFLCFLQTFRAQTSSPLRGVLCLQSEFYIPSTLWAHSYVTLSYLPFLHPFILWFHPIYQTESPLKPWTESCSIISLPQCLELCRPSIYDY